MEEISAQEPIRKTERERYLEFAYDVGESPAFVFQIKSSETQGFTESDVVRAIDIKNTLQKDRVAVVMIHREAQSINIAGILLKPESLDRLAEIKGGLVSDGIDCGFAMSLPEEGDVQSITIVDGHSTIYGSSVLALARAPKSTINDDGGGVIYRLASIDDGEDVIRSEKSTRLRKLELKKEKIQFAAQAQIDALPKHLFEKVDLEAEPLTVMELDVSDYQFFKLDINNSGQKIIDLAVSGDGDEEDKKAVEGRRLVIAANFKLLSNVAAIVQLHEGVYIASRLGDSLVIIMKRDTGNERLTSERTLRNAIMSFAERDTPDVFESTDGEASTDENRKKRLGHLTNIELPLEGIVRIYKVGDLVLFDKTWDLEGENKLEKYHKETNSLPSKTVRINDIK